MIISTLTMWISCLILAIGIEIIEFLFLIPYVSEKSIEAISLVAEVMFPICLSIAIYEGTPFALLILVVGLWKLGLPETYCHFERGLNHPMPNFKGLANSVGNFMVGTATFLHHSSIAWCTCALCSDLVTLNRYHIAIMVPLIVMHWANLLRYVDFKVYVIAELICEVIWEVEMVNFLQYHTSDTHEMMAASMLLFSHWYSWIGGTILLFSSDKDSVRSLAATVANVKLDELEHTWEEKDTMSNYFLDYLKDVQLFADLSSKDIRHIAAAMKPKHFENNELVISQGDQADSMYLLYKGAAVVEKDNQILPQIRYTSGDYFGELALVDKKTKCRAASVRAKGKVLCFQLGRSTFEELLLPHQALKNKMNAQRLKYAQNKQATTRSRSSSVPDFRKNMTTSDYTPKRLSFEPVVEDLDESTT